MEKHRPLIENHLLTIFNSSPSPIYVCAGNDLRVVYANEATLKVWGKDASIINKPIVEALPEIVDQPFPELLRRVYETGISYHSQQDRAELHTHDVLQTYYFKFTYQPLKEEDGSIWGVLCTATDVTELVEARREVEISQNNLRGMIMQAPVAICIVSGPEFVVEIANNKMLEVWGTSAQIVGKPIFEGLPEAKDQGFEELLQSVYRSGESFSAFERPADLPRNGRIETRYLNFVYAPLRETDDTINAVMAVAIDATEQALAQKRKDDFIGIASHELKTPLTSLKASIQLIERYTCKDPNEKLEKLVTQSATSVSKLTYLIEDLLSVTKLNEGQLTLNKEVFTLSKLIDDCCQHARMQGTHEIIPRGDLNLQVYADFHRIDQVLVNLVNNALKYAPDSGKIIITIERLAEYAKVIVQDFGAGIPKDKLQHLFQRYYRVDSSGHQFSGLGLGLYISNEIIIKHGGQMGVESKLGEGSAFWFTLPL